MIYLSSPLVSQKIGFSMIYLEQYHNRKLETFLYS